MGVNACNPSSVDLEVVEVGRDPGVVPRRWEKEGLSISKTGDASREMGTLELDGADSQ